MATGLLSKLQRDIDKQLSRFDDKHLMQSNFIVSWNLNMNMNKIHTKLTFPIAGKYQSTERKSM